MKKVLAILVAVIVSACSATQVPTTFGSTTKKIAVLSYAGNKFSTLEIAFIAFGNDYREDDIADWGVNDHLVQTATKLLSGKFEVVPFHADPNDLQDDDIFVGTSSSAIAAAIRKSPDFAARQDIDAFVVFVPGDHGLTMTNQISRGMGMTTQIRTYILHAIYDVKILNGRDLKEVAFNLGWEDVPFQEHFKDNPAVYVDKNYWAEDFDALTPEKKKVIAADLEKLADSVMPRLLQQVGLLP